MNLVFLETVPKAVAKFGEHAVRYISSGERGIKITSVRYTCVSDTLFQILLFSREECILFCCLILLPAV